MDRPAPLGTQRRQDPHPSVGGSLGYDEAARRRMLAQLHAGVPLHLIGASRSSLRRWIHNGVTRKRRTGNRESKKWRDGDLFLLILWRFAYPRTSREESAAFVANHSVNATMYAPQDISEAEKRIGLTRKVGSTTAERALTPAAQLRRQMFWTAPFPVGRFNIPRAHLLDVDEAGVGLDVVVPRIGKAMKNIRVFDVGAYGHSQQLNIIMAISPCGFRHVWVSAANTDATRFRAFLLDMMAQPQMPAPAAGGQQRTIMWDNLSAHHVPMVHNAVLLAGHRVLARPPYRPVDGPIEYAFQTMEMELTKRRHLVHNLADLRREIFNVVAAMNGFDRYFIHCGY